MKLAREKISHIQIKERCYVPNIELNSTIALSNLSNESSYKFNWILTHVKQKL